MSIVQIASFESKTRGPVDIYRGSDDATAAEIYKHAGDPDIRKTLGEKDLNRFAPSKFQKWSEKGGGRFMYTAWVAGHLAGLFWIGGEAFPKENFPKSPIQPAYTAAWRTGYATPEEDGTYEGEGIGKRIALVGIADVVYLTKFSGPTYEEDGKRITLPSLMESGIWLDTGKGNIDGQNLYHHLGNTDRDQEPIGFVDVGIYEPPKEDGKTDLQLEHRVGMVADPVTIPQLVVARELLIAA